MVFKRIFSLCFVCVLFLGLGLSFAVPASADGDGLGRWQYAVIPFEEIRFGTGYRSTVTFAGTNTVADSDVAVTSELGVTQFVIGGRTPDTPVGYNTHGDVEIHMAPTYSIRLVARDFVLNKENLEWLSMTFGDDGATGRVEWEFNIRTISTTVANSEGVRSYDIVNRSIPGSRDVDNYENLVPYMMPGLNMFTPHQFVYVDEFVITFTTNSDVGLTYWDFQYDVAGSSVELSAWFDQFNLKRETIIQNIVTEDGDPVFMGSVSLVDWLSHAIGGILDFELWDGFTINELIEFVVVMGLVFWFLTMLI